MSAWLVTRAHIDAMVNSALEHGLVDPKSTLDELSDLGRMLWRENNRSVNYRYNERRRTPDYRFVGTEAPLDPSAVEMLVDCYRYQSCERHDWERSKAYRWTNELLVLLKADPRYHGTFENIYGPGGVSMWGIEHLAQVPTVGPLT